MLYFFIAAYLSSTRGNVDNSEEPRAKPVGEELVLLAGYPAIRREHLRAFAVLAGLFLAFATVAPFASIQLPAVKTSIPAVGTGILMTDLITSALLFAQFSIVRWRALLVLASGYCFTALIVVPHALTFAADSIIGGGVQTTPCRLIQLRIGVSMPVLSMEHRYAEVVALDERV